MLLNSINFSNLNKINFKTNQNTSQISFTNKPDSFEKNSVSKFEFSEDLSTQARKQIIEKIKTIEDFPLGPLGIGATGVVYQLNNVDGFGYDGVVVKFSHTEDKNPITGEKQKPNCNFEDEIEKLKKAAPLGENSQQYLGRLKLSDGRYVLITTYIDGKTPDAITNPLNKESLKSLVNVLYELDSASVLHRDLKQENLLIDENNQAKLIDFGEAVDFNLFNNDECSGTLNFPPFELPTNFQNFEDTFLSPYYEQLKAQDPKKAKEFYKEYLNLKARNVYGKRMVELDRYLTKNFDKIEPFGIDRVLELVDYQKTMAMVLGAGKISDTIMNIELMRNQVTYLSELAYKNEILLGNPLANITLKTNALISAKKLEAMARKELERPNHPEVKKYLEYQIEIAKYRQGKISGWLEGLVGWFCTCMKTDINTPDVSKSKLIHECIDNKELENFTIPNIADKVN